MKITGIETFVVDAGWRPWQFVAVRTDAGITGYGECSDGRNPYGVVATVHDFESVLLGRDPRPVEARYWDMYRMARQSQGGIAAKAIAGIELALWDIKAKALAVPVYERFGTRQRSPMDPARVGKVAAAPGRAARRRPWAWWSAACRRTASPSPGALPTSPAATSAPSPPPATPASTPRAARRTSALACR